MLNPNSTEADKLLQDELLEGEKLLWTGGAGKGVKFVLRDIMLIPLGIIFFFVALICESLVLIGMPFLYKIGFSLIGIPFIILGFYLLIGRFWLDMRRRAKTFYGITPKRLIIKLIRYGTFVKFLISKHYQLWRSTRDLMAAEPLNLTQIFHIIRPGKADTLRGR